MSYKVLKTVDMELSTQSINHAIREIRKFRQQLRETCWELVEALTMEGAEIAKMQVVSLDAVDTGELEHSIGGMFFPSERCGFVIAEAPYAIYVEYGTGPVGDDNPHPEAQGVYDYNVRQAEHILKYGKDAWIYKSDKDGKFHWSQGYVSRPFMYNTLRWLEEAAPERMSEMLSQM